MAFEPLVTFVALSKRTLSNRKVNQKYKQKIEFWGGSYTGTFLKEFVRPTKIQQKLPI